MRAVRAMMVMVAMSSVACVVVEADDTKTDEGRVTNGATDPGLEEGGSLRHLPDLRGLVDGGCEEGVLTGCSLKATKGGNPLTVARNIYDDYFHKRRPKTDAEWGWRDATPAELIRIKKRPPILPLPEGATKPTKREYQAWMSLQPNPWRLFEHKQALRYSTYTEKTDDELPFIRNSDPDSTSKNITLLQSHLNDQEELASTDRARAAYYEKQNPFDWQTAAMTAYAIPTTKYSDIMATNFVYRIILDPYQMEQALADCNADPDIPCVESVAALSEGDMHKVYDLELIRLKPGTELDAVPVLQVSRTVRVVSVDSGHAVDRQATYGPGGTDKVTGATTKSSFDDPFLPTYAELGPEVLWRLEIGGQLFKQLTDFLPKLGRDRGGSVAGFVRYAHDNGKGDADKPPPGSCTDYNEYEYQCQRDDEDRVFTMRCRTQKWQIANTGCHIPGRPDAEIVPVPH